MRYLVMEHQDLLKYLWVNCYHLYDLGLSPRFDIISIISPLRDALREL